MTHVLTFGAHGPRARRGGWSWAGAGRFAAGLGRRAGRTAMLLAGSGLVLLGVLIAPLPGPLGLPLSIVGLILVLRSSYWAKRQFIRAQHARPRYVYPFRRLMRRKPEVAPVLWQQTLRMEKLLLKRGTRVLAKGRRAFRKTMRTTFSR